RSPHLATYLSRIFFRVLRRHYVFPYYFFFFFLLLPPPPTSTLFPYTTLFRSIASSTVPDSIKIRVVAYWVASRRSPTLRRRSARSEEHTSELQSPDHLVCRLLLEKKKKTK